MFSRVESELFATPAHPFPYLSRRTVNGNAFFEAFLSLSLFMCVWFIAWKCHYSSKDETSFNYFWPVTQKKWWKKNLSLQSPRMRVRKLRYARPVCKLRTYTADLQNGWKEASAAKIVSSRFAPLFCSRQPFMISPHRFPYAKSYPEAHSPLRDETTKNFTAYRERSLWRMRNGRLHWIRFPFVPRGFSILNSSIEFSNKRCLSA